MKHVLMLLTLLLSTEALTQTKGWKQVPGPNSGAPQQIEIGYRGVIYVLSSDYNSTLAKLYYRDTNKQWHRSNLPYSFYNNAQAQNSTIATESNGAILLFNTSSDNSSTPSGIFRSTDKGNTWKKVLSNSFISAIHQSTVSGNLYAFKGGLNINYTAIFRSTDHGATWDSLTAIPLPSYSFLVDNNDQCYFSLHSFTEIGIIRYNAKTNLYKAIITTISAGPENVPTISFCKGMLCVRSDSSFFTVTSDDSLKKIGTIKRGFGFLYSGNSGNLYTGAVSDTNSSYFQTMVSSDLGKSWKPFNIGVDNIITSGFYYYMPYLKFAFDSVGNDYIGEAFSSGYPGLYQSANNGNPWRPIGLPSSQIRVLQEGPENTIYASDYYPSSSSSSGITYYYPLSGHISSDGGISWQKPSTLFPTLSWPIGSFGKSGDGGFFYFKDSNYAVRAIYNSDKSAPGNFEISTSTFFPALPTIFGSLNDRFYTILNTDLIWTSDKGVTWEALTIPMTGPYLNTFSIDSKGVIYLGYAPAIYKSSDEGQNWNKVLTPIKNAFISTIKFTSTDNIIVGTLGDGLWHSTNGGNLWNKWAPPEFDSISAIEVVGSTCYVATTKGLISCALTSDSWHNELFVEENQEILQLFRSDSGYLYASVPDMGIWTTNPNIPVFRTIRSASEGFSLKIDEAFDHSQTVTFVLKEYEHISITLYDILGHKLQTISEGNFDAGEHRIPLSIASLATGMYCVVLSTSTETVSAKLLVNH